jgi:pimeloyl-ACP methyl ester carboxylesterase
MIRAASSDGVSVAVHELAGREGQPIVLFGHATGFHGHAYLPIAKHLAPAFHSWGMDYRGHGDTSRPPAWTVTWDGFGDDAVAAAEVLAASPGGAGGIVGFGHSMGATGLLMAAARRPELFRLLVVFEPIVFPTDRAQDPERPNTLRDGARKRRAVFDSFEAAIANFASKPPMAAFDPDALDAYVRHGFTQQGDHVRLKCDPDTEADTFDNGGKHTTWDSLAGIRTRVIVVAGRPEEERPSSVAAQIADELPDGRFVGIESMDHFGPMTHPAEIAGLIADAASEGHRSP